MKLSHSRDYLLNAARSDVQIAMVHHTPIQSNSSVPPSRVRRLLCAIRDTANEMLEVIWPRECLACHGQLETTTSMKGTAEPIEAGFARPPDHAHPAGANTHQISLIRPMLCSACTLLAQPLLSAHYCPRCARTVRPESIKDRGCAWCRTERVWNIAGIARLGPYVTPLRELLCDLKFRGSQPAAVWLAEHLASELRRQTWFERVEVLVPVPMHWLRRMQRPCAHARVLADALGSRLRLPVRSWVSRRKYTPSQMQVVSRTARMENVAGCFAPPMWKLGRIQGRRVCIVDNLVVSAATIHEVSKQLRSLGAAEVYAAVACRAVGVGGFQAKPDAARRIDR